MSLNDHDFQESIGGYIECKCGWPTKEQWEAGENPAVHVVAEALEEAATAMRAAWEGNWNLRDPQDPEVAYSVDRWLEVRAARLREGQQ